MSDQNLISVLIADDEESIRQGLKNAIRWDELNTKVIAVASDGQQAFSCIQQMNPDISIIDICMPAMDGLEVIRQSKEMGFHTEFIILSGYNDFSYAQEAIQYGAKSYLLKPLNLEKLTDELYKLCNSITQRKSIKIDLEQLRKTSRLNLLNQLIHGEIHLDDSNNGRLQELKMHLINRPNRVIVCSIRNLEEIPYFEEEIISMLEQVFYDIPCEIWSPNAYQIVLLFNDGTKDNQLSNNLAKRCLWKLSSYHNCLIGIGIGDQVPDLNQTSYSYNRALLTSSYQIYNDKPAIHDPSIICNEAPAMSPSNIDYSELSEAILSANDEKMRNYCDAFFHSLFYVPQPPPTFAKSMCIYLVVNVLKDLNAKVDPNFSFPIVTYEELNQLVTFAEIKDWMLNYFYDCCKTSATLRTINRKTFKDPIIEACKQYIQENIKNNIKTREIAFNVNLSDSYCAAYFKQKTGVNLRDYILNSKMDYAKKRIIDDRMLVSEVAYELGYTDYRSFSRAFKNVTGVSPSDYNKI